MLAIDNALGPLFALILIGLVLGRFHYPGGDFWTRAEKLIYYILFPAMLVHVMALADMSQVPVGKLALVTIGATLLVAVALWLARSYTTPDTGSFTSIFQGAIRFNSYVAIAGAVALHGDQGATLSAVILALLVPTVNLLSVGCFELVGAKKVNWWHSIGVILRNPLIVACIVGIGLNLTGIGLPGWSEPILGLMARPALPLALIAVGVALRLSSLAELSLRMWLPSFIKLAVLPAVALLLALIVGLDPVSRDVVLLFLACSTATSAYILARQLGGNADLMASLITLQTLLAMLTLPVWLGVLT